MPTLCQADRQPQEEGRRHQEARARHPGRRVHPPERLEVEPHAVDDEPRHQDGEGQLARADQCGLQDGLRRSTTIPQAPRPKRTRSPTTVTHRLRATTSEW